MVDGIYEVHEVFSRKIIQKIFFGKQIIIIEMTINY